MSAKDYEVLIVGAGVIGLAIARSLAEYNKVLCDIFKAIKTFF